MPVPVKIPEQSYTDLIEESPLGALGIVVTDLGLRVVAYTDGWDDFFQQLYSVHIIIPQKIKPANTNKYSRGLLASARTQLLEYLNGERKAFDLPIDWSGMRPFQSDVLHATLEIPYGQTASYQDIAFAIKNPNAARAVGAAEAHNPMPLVIPCHRVIGSDGKLHGYGGPGGVETKRWLLQLEGALP